MEADDLDLDLDLGGGWSVEEGGVHWVVAVDRDREEERSWVGDLGHLMEEGLLMDSGRPWQILVSCWEEMSTERWISW